LIERLKSIFNRIIQPGIGLNWLEGLSIILSFWLIIFPVPYKELFTIVLFLPVVGFLLNWILAKRKLKYSKRPSIYTFVRKTKIRDGDYSYDIVTYIGLPALALLIRVTLDYMYNLVSMKYLLLPYLGGLLLVIIVISIFYRVVFYIPTRRKRVYLEILAYIFCYTYGAVFGINFVYDNTIINEYSSIVINKNKSRVGGRHKRISFDLILYKIDNQIESKPITLSVSEKYFYHTSEGDTVTLVEKAGTFNIPYYTMQR